MNIEVGKFYRLRCGGAVRIERISKIGLAETYYTAWNLDGSWDDQESPSPIDLIAEITEAEYNRIIAGEAGGNLKQVEALQDEINALKRTLSEMCETNLKAFEKQQDERRFEAAKSAIQGMLANGASWDVAAQIVNAKRAVDQADALLKAWEESK
jgi:hypothetical protein